jgi:hypothetical protein
VQVDLLLFPECFLQGYLVTGEQVHSQAFEMRSLKFAAVLTWSAPASPVRGRTPPPRVDASPPPSEASQLAPSGHGM